MLTFIFGSSRLCTLALIPKIRFTLLNYVFYVHNFRLNNKYDGCFSGLKLENLVLAQISSVFFPFFSCLREILNLHDGMCGPQYRSKTVSYQLFVRLQNKVGQGWLNDARLQCETISFIGDACGFNLSEYIDNDNRI